MIRLSLAGAAGVVLLALPVHAQYNVSTGVTAGAMRFAGGRTQDAVSVVVLFRPLPWLHVSAAPGYARTTLGTVSQSGLTDIPLSLGAVHEFEDAMWSPSIAAGLSGTLSPGDTAAALGLGRGAYAGMGALSVSPTDRVNLSTSLSHPFTANSGNGSVALESEMSFGRTTGSVGFSSEIGRADSAAVLARSVAAGLAYSLAGPLTLAVDGSHGLTGSAPTWTFSVGIGTAFGGLSPLDPTSPLKRLKSALGSKTTATSGYSKTSSGSTSCKKTGTC